MTLRKVVAGETIIKEGDPGDEMYIIDKGTFNVFKKDESGKDKTFIDASIKNDYHNSKSQMRVVRAICKIDL